MYQNPLDHSNHRMLYSFSTGQSPQQPHPIYAQIVDPTNSRTYANYNQFIPTQIIPQSVPLS